MGACLRTALQLSVAYDQKVMERLKRDPLRLLHLAWEAPHVECRQRRQLAVDIIEAAESDATRLHLSTRKLLSLFEIELRHTATTGTIFLSLHILMKIIAIHWKAHVAELEGGW